MSKNKISVRYYIASIILLFAFGSLPVTWANETAECSSVIQSIVTQGTRVTKDYNLVAWSELKVGQSINQKDIELAQQNLLDKGLFKSVEIQHEDLCKPHNRITLVVKEKYYHIAYPRLYRNSDGDISRGIKYRGNNLFGADQSLNISFTEEDLDTGETVEAFRMDYDLPLIESPFRYRWSFLSSDKLLTDTLQPITKTEKKITMQFTCRCEPYTLIYPFDIFMKTSFQNIGLDGYDPNISIQPGDYYSLGFKLEHDDIHRQYYRRFGQYFGIELSKGITQFGSDFDTARLELEARFYHRLNELDNVNSRFIVKLASDKVFNEFNYSIGGASSIRGIDSGLVSGNSLWQANIEYLKGYNRWPSFRSVLFTDIGNVFEDAGTFNRHNWKMTLGLGLRWKLTSFVKTDLVIDYAYDPDTEYSKVYGGTSLEF